MDQLKFKLFLLTKLPLAWVAGLKKIEVTSKQAIIGINYGYWNMNPFKSMYFAAQAMAAEMASGILVLECCKTSGKNISTLVLGLKAEFSKKAVGKIKFVCSEGDLIAESINKAIASGQGESFDVKSIGYNEQNEIVATFVLTWTVKERSKSVK